MAVSKVAKRLRNGHGDEKIKTALFLAKADMDPLWIGAQSALEDIRAAVERADGAKLRRGATRLGARIQEAPASGMGRAAPRLFAEAVQDGFEAGWRGEWERNGGVSPRLWEGFPDACAHLALLSQDAQSQEAALVAEAILIMARSAIEERPHYEALTEKNYGHALASGSSFCAALRAWDCCREINPNFAPEARLELGLMLMAWGINLNEDQTSRWDKIGLGWLAAHALSTVEIEPLREAQRLASVELTKAATARWSQAPGARRGLPRG
jgi:hypothetical protein